MKLFKEAKAPLGYIWSLQHLALVAIQQKEFAEAHMLLEEGLKASRVLGKKFFEATFLLRLGQANRAQGNYAVAGTQLKEALALYQDLGDKVCVANIRYHLGQVAFDEGEYAKALSLVEE